MRKLAAILLIFFYSLANTGFAAELNLCGDALISVSIPMGEEQGEHDCCICPSENNLQDDCCKNEEIIVKAEAKEHQASKILSCDYIPVLGQSFIQDLPENSELAGYSHGSSDFVPRAERILFCVYRI